MNKASPRPRSAQQDVQGWLPRVVVHASQDDLSMSGKLIRDLPHGRMFISSSGDKAPRVGSEVRIAIFEPREHMPVELIGKVVTRVSLEESVRTGNAAGFAVQFKPHDAATQANIALLMEKYGELDPGLSRKMLRLWRQQPYLVCGAVLGVGSLVLLLIGLSFAPVFSLAAPGSTERSHEPGSAASVGAGSVYQGVTGAAPHARDFGPGLGYPPAPMVDVPPLPVDSLQAPVVPPPDPLTTTPAMHNPGGVNGTRPPRAVPGISVPAPS